MLQTRDIAERGGLRGGEKSGDRAPGQEISRDQGTKSLKIGKVGLIASILLGGSHLLVQSLGA
jgi:hypothetical protein